MIKGSLTLYFNSWWRPSAFYICLLVIIVIIESLRWQPPAVLAVVLLCVAGIAFLGIIAASVWNLIMKRWRIGVINIILTFGSGAATVICLGFLLFASMFRLREDKFADNLTIPEGIEIADPDPSDTMEVNATTGIDEFQDRVRKVLAVPGGDVEEFTPDMPSLRRASTDHAKLFGDYIEASPDWHVFIERGNRFAARRWTIRGEPRVELHGYISELDGDAGFQTRCLVCLDRKQWGWYSVQHVEEGKRPVQPVMSFDNNLHESRVMIKCGGVWVEIFEQSGKPERRVTKATLSALEKEFSKFLVDPQDALAEARVRSTELARNQTGKDGQPFRLVDGIQPGIYVAVFSLNPGEPGSVYLKAFEVTKEMPLSVGSLRSNSETRMTWSTNPTERFGAKTGFTVYEGDSYNPYAARFEVWFKPDSGKPERKLAERLFKISGWDR
jgi:hypothetical protein